jgi:hypothetical protein
MKKYILLVLLLLPVLPAAAQWFVSGNLDFNLSRHTRDQGFDVTKPEGIVLRFEPRVGYTFSPSLQAGVTLLLSNQKYTYTDGYYNQDDEEWKTLEITDRTLMTAGVGFFVRQRCLDLGPFRFKFSKRLLEDFITRLFLSSDKQSFRSGMTVPVVPVLRIRFRDQAVKEKLGIILQVKTAAVIK